MTSPRATRGSRPADRPSGAYTRKRETPADEGVPRRLLIRRGIAFAGAAALPTWLAMHGGGYDIVIRQQTAIVVWWAIAVGFGFGVLPRARFDRSLIIPAAALAG